MIQGSADMQEVKLVFVERQHEYGEVYTYIFRSKEKVVYEAGQYGHVQLFGMPDGVKAVREFSFASAPHESDIRFGVDARSGSAYQKKLKELESGDEVGLFKIKGHMAWPPEGYSDVVMIAGGVGVVPFRSQIIDYAHKRLSLGITLIQASKSEYLYQEELSSKVGEYYPIRREELENSLKTTVSEHQKAMYFIAGPPGFVETVNNILHEAGINALQSDSFKGLID